MLITVVAILFLGVIVSSSAAGSLVSSRSFVFVRHLHTLRRSLAIASATLPLCAATPSFAVEELPLSSATITTIKVMTTAAPSDSGGESLEVREAARVKRKLELQSKSRDGGTALDDKSYIGSLKREQLKQKDRVKGKTARSKDLCEVLGRGC